MRLWRNILKIPNESDFNALSLFPDIEGALYLDVGANRGQSIDAILMKKKDIRIHLFEPNELLFKKLQDRFCGKEGIVMHNFGLGDKDTEKTLFVPFYKKWMFDGLASFNEEDPRNYLKEGIFGYRDQFLTLQKVTSQLKTLDELNLDPFFIKIDIEGYEYNVLKGGEQTILKYEPILLIEWPSDQIIDYLRNYGYQLYAFKQGKFIPGIRGKLNTFFMTQKKISLIATS